MTKTKPKKHKASVMLGGKTVKGEVVFEHGSFGHGHKWTFTASILTKGLYGDISLEGDGCTEFRDCFLHMAKAGVALELGVEKEKGK